MNWISSVFILVEANTDSMNMNKSFDLDDVFGYVKKIIFFGFLILISFSQTASQKLTPKPFRAGFASASLL